MVLPVMATLETVLPPDTVNADVAGTMLARVSDMVMAMVVGAALATWALLNVGAVVSLGCTLLVIARPLKFASRLPQVSRALFVPGWVYATVRAASPFTNAADTVRLIVLP